MAINDLRGVVTVLGRGVMDFQTVWGGVHGLFLLNFQDQYIIILRGKGTMNFPSTVGTGVVTNILHRGSFYLGINGHSLNC